MSQQRPPGPRAGKQRAYKPVPVRPPRVYKGCIRPKPNVLTKRKHDQVSTTPRQQALRAKAVKRAAKLDILAGIDECTWRTSSRGGLRDSHDSLLCCANRFGTCNGLPVWLHASTSKNSQADVAATIGRVRRYIADIDDEMLRVFICQYTYFNGYDRADATGATRLVKGSKQYVCYLPALPAMKTALQATTMGGVFQPPPAHTLYSVCSAWFFFVLGIHKDKFYDQALRKAIYDRGPYAEARDLDVGIPPVRSKGKDGSRPQVHYKNVCAFLMALAEISEALPNMAKGDRTTKVLPCRTIQSVHMLYVHEAECKLNLSWASEQRTDGAYSPPEVEYASEVRRRTRAAVRVGLLRDSDDDSDGVDDPLDNVRLAPAAPDVGLRAQGAQRRRDEREEEWQQIDSENRERRSAKIKYRYGNKKLGPVIDTRPEKESVRVVFVLCVPP